MHPPKLSTNSFTRSEPRSGSGEILTFRPYVYGASKPDEGSGPSLANQL